MSCLALGVVAQAADISLTIGGARPGGEKVALLVGGGCDDDRDNFETEFNQWGDFLEARGWDVRGWVDPSKHTHLTHVQPLEWRGVLTELENLSGEAPSQVLVVLISHGNYKDAEHGICAERETYYPVLDLAIPLDALERAGVQTAVIDMSCYSAYSVEELQQHASCVMSATGKESGNSIITRAVARNLAQLPTLQGTPSVEDVWFSVLEASIGKNRQLAGISSSIPLAYIHYSSWGKEEKLLPFNREDTRKFFENEKAVFSKVFSEPTLKGISDYLKGGNFQADSVGVLGVRYLQVTPQAELRACAKFYL